MLRLLIISLSDLTSMQTSKRQPLLHATGATEGSTLKSLVAAAATVLSELDGILAIKEKQNKQKNGSGGFFLVVKMFFIYPGHEWATLG